jgi:hypothetical protein
MAYLNVYGGKTFSANDIRQVMETLNLFVFACVNPDGRHYSQTSAANHVDRASASS